MKLINILSCFYVLLFFIQSSPRKLIVQRSECDNSSNVADQDFIADFSQFTKKNNENMNCVDAGTMTHTQKFAGSRGAFHIYKKPSPSNYLN